MTQVVESFQGLPIRRVLQSPVEPIGVQRFSELAADMFADVDPMAGGRCADRDRGRAGPTGGTSSRCRCRLVERGDIALSRSGTDLVVTVGDVRRRIALPSVLQRCSTEGASFEQGRLIIDFAADPALWPASLTPAPWSVPGDRPPESRPTQPAVGPLGPGGSAAARRRRRPVVVDEAR